MLDCGDLCVFFVFLWQASHTQDPEEILRRLDGQDLNDLSLLVSLTISSKKLKQPTAFGKTPFDAHMKASLTQVRDWNDGWDWQSFGCKDILYFFWCT